MVKFSRDLVCAVLEPADDVTLTVSGKITERVYFEGADTIRVIDKGKQKARKNGRRNGWADVGAAVPGSELAECFVYYFHLDHLGTPLLISRLFRRDFSDYFERAVIFSDYLVVGRSGRSAQV